MLAVVELPRHIQADLPEVWAGLPWLPEGSACWIGSNPKQSVPEIQGSANPIPITEDPQLGGKHWPMDTVT